ncbi:MAG: hypothetical protein EOP56_03745 [Sphingobacteriales bacterium]|nr:MAG: hypothetical protein EOP56_03745 [Sphingobacteriales bacterium]
MIIQELKKVGDDERGYTIEYTPKRTGTHMIAFRVAGSVSGRHYHKGLSATKDPEILVLMQGRCIFNWFDVTKEDQTPSTLVLNGPIQLEIPKNTWHEVIAETDCTFLEFNSVAEHAADTFYIS